VPILAIAGAGCDATVAIARAMAALPGAAIHVGTWPVGWTLAEVAGLAVSLAVLFWRRSGAGAS
jgi:hypothetical protein